MSRFNHRPRKKPRKRNGGNRKRRQCQLCPLVVVHLPRHLRDAHDIGRETIKRHLQYIKDVPSLQLTDSPVIINKDICKEQISNNWTAHELLSSYFKWLRSMENNKTKQEATNRVKQVHKIWESIDSTINLSSITDGDCIRDNWLEKVKELLAPGTLKSYIGSLRNFYSFLRASNINVDVKLLDQTARWIANITKSSHQRIIEMRVQESIERITPSDLKHFIESKTSKSCQEILEHSCVSEMINKNIYLMIRNYIMLLTLIHNGQRVGAIRNFNLKSFRNADERNGHMIAVVAAHKTGNKYPANLIFNKGLWKSLNVFVLKIRPKLPNFSNDLYAHDSPIFLSWPKEKFDKPGQMTDSVINSAFNRIWKMGTSSNKAINATKLRKSTTTHVRTAHPDIRESLAHQMTHRPSTADKYYVLEQSKEQSVQVVNLIQKVMFQGELSELNSQTDNENVSALLQEKPNHGRRAFDKEDSAIILKLCEDIIKRGGTISNQEIIDRLKCDGRGNEIIHRYLPVYGSALWKKLSDRVRTENRRYARQKQKK